MPRVTIVAPTYNASRFVQQCVESVLAQTFGDFELVVADDGSTDGTPDVVESYRDPRVRCLRLPHRGLRALAQTYNAALSAGTGDLVAVLEGDDYWPPDKLEVQVRGFDDPSVQLSWGAGLEVDLQGRTLKVSRHAPVDGVDRRFANGELFRSLLRSYTLSPSITVMARRAALDRIGGFRQDGSVHYVDLPTWLLLLARNPGVALYHGHLVGFWRRHPAQTTSRHGYSLVRERWRVIRDVVATLDDDARAAVGWTEALARENRTRWCIGAGRAALRAGRFDRARRLHLEALRRAPSVSLQLRALSGVAASTARLDLPGAWRRLRRRA
ncbi:glycosyltransferase family 2 protein [Anaeromyxobacter terrae]|uniref:glycosyltransferase family 2 protein n=1 Tax=Anaeromyxobacter terrae TaxID=2925406 RepID=UPI001F56EDEE|nr:glycosyltransferase family 2 protein [Anaeromyxobacter sp. SG22]